MPVWCSSSDGHAAKGEIELESKTRGWDLLSRASSKDQLTIGEAQRRKFITHLERQYKKTFCVCVRVCACLFCVCVRVSPYVCACVFGNSMCVGQ